jgi:hypothetical protein
VKITTGSASVDDVIGGGIETQARAACDGCSLANARLSFR